MLHFEHFESEGEITEWCYLWGSCCGYCEGCCPLGYDTLFFVRFSPMFWRNVLLPSSTLKMKAVSFSKMLMN